uniref:ribonucleoside-diphosphate reductase n=1 Tax=viral metagenome TaxID=1070528 RepID=A0A6M3IUC5_9ZZZZ
MLKRPEILQGKAYRVPNDRGGKIWVIINHTQDCLALYEVFIYAEKGHTDLSVHTEALGRILSIALRYGVPAEELIHQMLNIRGSNPVWLDGEEIFSLPDGVAKVMKKALDNLKELNPQEEQEYIDRWNKTKRINRHQEQTQEKAGIDISSI